MLEFCNQLLNLNLVQNFRLELFEKVFFFITLSSLQLSKTKKKKVLSYRITQPPFGGGGGGRLASAVICF